MVPVQFAAELAAYAKSHKPITLGLVGAGQMGTDIIINVAFMPGIRIGAVAERRQVQGAIDAALMAGWTLDEITKATTGQAIDQAIHDGKFVITQDLAALCASTEIDVIVDATGNPNAGAIVAMAAINAGKHIVMLNVETDVTIGRTLMAAAEKAGVIYTGAAGDEPAATVELIAFAQSVGLEVICAGKGKNNPLKFDATPDEFEDEARERNMNARMLVEFVDGSKTMIEMTAVANATGLVPDVPGMHGPKATIDDLASVLCTREDGGILSGPGKVDYSIGKGVAPGVFCIVKGRHPRVTERISDLKVGPGPNFALLRPFHLTSLETPLSAAKAIMHGKPELQPLAYPVAECVSIAKRDLAPGTKLGRIGQYDYRGFTMVWGQARAARGIPLGLTEGAIVTQQIKAGEHLTYDNCALDSSLLITQIRAAQDKADERF